MISAACSRPNQLRQGQTGWPLGRGGACKWATLLAYNHAPRARRRCFCLVCPSNFRLGAEMLILLRHSLPASSTLARSSPKVAFVRRSSSLYSSCTAATENDTCHSNDQLRSACSGSREIGGARGRINDFLFPRSGLTQFRWRAGRHLVPRSTSNWPSALRSWGAERPGWRAGEPQAQARLR